MGNKTEPVIICPKMFFAQDSGQGILELHPKCWRANKLGPFHSSPAVALESISASLLHLGRLRLDDKWIWGPRSNLHTHPHHHLFFCWCFSKHRKPLTPQNASGSLGSFSNGKWCYFYTNCCSHHKFPTPCYSVTSSVRGLFTSHLSSECRWQRWVWMLGSAPEGLQQKWWPLRDRMLTWVWGMLALCSHYLLWVAVTTFTFCYYNRPVFRKHMAASLNNFSLNMWLYSPCLIDEKRTSGFSLT